ncbi:hypothetical protein D8674_036021 [Pyrus ussuriensis x Pyrus communis]|uniref:Uncharacterized protein n=1 Tax=Pyrus ussuriensis x Pyrus communis TaxID=2448454 RepID=A0A5N5GE11_9ROSA|nr:hypothetical protein D8674_036021 [Pyrus ussuriensis x Pyrus communis]
MAAWRRSDWTGVMSLWASGTRERKMRLDALRRASAASTSPAKHFAYSSKTEAFASPSSLKGALGAPRGEFFKTLLCVELIGRLHKFVTYYSHI